MSGRRLAMTAVPPIRTKCRPRTKGIKMPRSNGWGGARPGAGRKPTPPHVVPDQTPLEFLHGVMIGAIQPSPRQLAAAIAAARYVHLPAEAAGKKAKQSEAAKKAAAGRFKPAAPPLVLVRKD